MQHALLIVVVVGFALVPAAASAGGRGHHGGVIAVAPRESVVITSPSPVVVRPGQRVFPTVVHPHHFFPRFGAPVIVTRPFFPLILSTPAVIVYSQPAIYAPPPVVSVAPSAPPVPKVIEYPTGWYQLRGDGVTTPYVWVWIPQPPPPPASEAPPAVPPAPPADAPADPPTVPPVRPRSCPSLGELYCWTDEQGGAHWTDRLDNIPERYRPRVQRLS